MTLIFKANTPEQALVAVTDWLVERAKNRAAAGNANEDKGRALLDYSSSRAIEQAAEDLAHAEIVPYATREPEPVDRAWNVVGTVHLANGFDLVVDAPSREVAETRAEDIVRNGDYHLEAEVQEVCVQSCDEVNEDDEPTDPDTARTESEVEAYRRGEGLPTRMVPEQPNAEGK